MKNYRVLSSIVIFSGILSIVGMPISTDAATLKSPKSTVELEAVEVEKMDVKPEKSLERMRHQQISFNTKENIANKSTSPEYNELEKPLDLSLPYKVPENSDLKIKQNTSSQRPEPNIFTPETKKKTQPLQLNGNLLMSPEPEAGKQKSVDGAGIVINIKP
ncbi:MAG: hypothetical protein PHG00_13875 [Methylococcales bacterium]|nr:hypothetical protein [Methylococcales bacterium]